MRELLMVVIGMVTLVVGAVAADVDVTAAEIEETRRTRLAPQPEEDRFGSLDLDAPKLTLTLELRGAAAGAAVEFGHLKLKTAELDNGAKLELLKTRFDFEDVVKGFKEIQRDMPMSDDEPPPPDKRITEIPLVFAPAPRAATAIERLAGSFVLRTPTLKTIRIEDPLGKAGEAVEDPALAKAGLKLEFAESRRGNEVSLQVKGDPARVRELALHNAAGEEISWGTSRMTMGSVSQVGVQAQEEITADCVLEIVVATAFADTEVEFDLKSLKLP